MKRLKPSTRSLRTLGENGNLDANSEPGICFGTDSSDVNGYRWAQDMKTGSVHSEVGAGGKPSRKAAVGNESLQCASLRLIQNWRAPELLCYWEEDYSIVKTKILIKMLLLLLSTLSNCLVFGCFFFCLAWGIYSVMTQKKEYHKWIAKVTVEITYCVLHHETGNEKRLWLFTE